MKYPIGIEGDYLLTKNSRLYFDVKGIHHPDDRKISFIRFYPSKEGDRIKNCKMYKKIYALNSFGTSFALIYSKAKRIP